MKILTPKQLKMQNINPETKVNFHCITTIPESYDVENEENIISNRLSFNVNKTRCLVEEVPVKGEISGIEVETTACIIRIVGTIEYRITTYLDVDEDPVHKMAVNGPRFDDKLNATVSKTGYVTLDNVVGGYQKKSDADDDLKNVDLDLHSIDSDLGIIGRLENVKVVNVSDNEFPGLLTIMYSGTFELPTLN